jgi:tripartite-type tricarboxylate transporter receptor subunit TctC
VSSVPFVLVIATSVPARTLAEFIAYAKANPGKLNFGAAVGTPPHLVGELFKVVTGTDIVFVPYKGAIRSRVYRRSALFKLRISAIADMRPA